VELLEIKPDDEQEQVVTEEAAQASPETWRETGIIEDGETIGKSTNGGMSRIYDRLVQDGRAGGRQAIGGAKKTLLNSVDRSANYKLIIFDKTFLSRSEAAKKRMLQEWSNALTESLKTPVVTMKELQYRYQFGPKHFVKLALYGIATAAVVYLLFLFSPQVINFLSKTSTESKVIATICILAFVPIFAQLYSTVTGLLLKLIKLE